MPPRSNASAAEVAPPSLQPEVDLPLFVREIQPSEYATRQIRCVVNDHVSGRIGRPGVTAALRDAASGADGRAIVITIAYK